MDDEQDKQTPHVPVRVTVSISVKGGDSEADRKGVGQHVLMQCLNTGLIVDTVSNTSFSPDDINIYIDMGSI